MLKVAGELSLELGAYENAASDLNEVRCIYCGSNWNSATKIYNFNPVWFIIFFVQACIQEPAASEVRRLLCQVSPATFIASRV